jgi:hypothetical protein
VLIKNLGGIEVSDLIVIGSGRGANQGSGIDVRNELPDAQKLEHIRIDNIDASGFGLHGIVVHGIPADNSKSGFRDVRITNCVAHDNVHTGIYVCGHYRAIGPGYANEDVYVGHCTAYGNSGTPGYHNHSGNGIFIAQVDRGLIERCVAYENGFLCDFAGGGPIGIWTASANAVTIQHCESHHNRTGAGSVDGGGFDFDGGVTNSIMQYNYSHDNDGAGYLVYEYGAPYPFHGNIVRYNISQDDGRKNGYGGIWCGGPIRDCEIYHNTIFLSPPESGRPSGLRARGENVRFCNNLIIATGGLSLVDGQSGPGLALHGNTYWTPDGQFRIVWNGKVYTDLEGWRQATGQELVEGGATGLTVDPKLVGPGKGGTINDAAKLSQLTQYRLDARSPVIDAGLDLPARFGLEVGPSDYFGNTIPQGGGYDIGAHEAR